MLDRAILGPATAPPPRDPLGLYAERAGLSPVIQRIRLRGTLQVGSGLRARAELCRCARGVFLIGARSATVGGSLPIVPTSRGHLETRALRTTLTVAEQRWGIPRGQRRQVELLLGLAHLGVGSAAPPQPPRGGLLVDPPTDLEQAWLTTALAPEEVVVAWLRTVSTRSIPSWLGGDASARVRLLLTDQRFGALALSHRGDAELIELDPGAVHLEEHRGRTTLVHAGLAFELPKARAAAVRRLVPLLAAPAAERLFAAARLEWLDGDQASAPQCQALLAAAARRGDARAVFAAFLVAAATGSAADPTLDLAAALARLDREGIPADGLVELCRDLRVGPAPLRALVAGLRQLPGTAEPWALELHLFLHDQWPSRELTDATLEDLSLAEHLVAVGERQRAVHLLEERLGTLPRESLALVLAPQDADLTRTAGTQALRAQLLELLATAHGDTLQPDVRAVTELARLHPLVSDRLRRLVTVADDDLRRRANAVLSLLEPGAGEDEAGAAELASVVRPLSEKLIDAVLRHPASRADNPVIARVQELLARAPKPDVGMLRDYCEELNAATHPEAALALREASRALGIRVRAYVSRGAKGVGLRAYENDSQFVLIGGQHLGAGDFAMNRAELSFAIGAELAHLRFGHVRVTSSDVWAGALEKGQQGLDMALSVLPIFRGLKLADRAVSMTSRVPLPLVRRVVNAASGVRASILGQRVRPATADEFDVLTTPNEQLVVAQRMMQLSADRAGLLLAQDIRPALRAMLLIRRDYRAEIPSMQRHGLTHVLGTRAADGHMAYQDLAIRVAALIAFYLSDDFVRLRAALYD